MMDIHPSRHLTDHCIPCRASFGNLRVLARRVPPLQGLLLSLTLTPTLTQMSQSPLELEPCLFIKDELAEDLLSYLSLIHI